MLRYAPNASIRAQLVEVIRKLYQLQIKKWIYIRFEHIKRIDNSLAK